MDWFTFSGGGTDRSRADERQFHKLNQQVMNASDIVPQMFGAQADGTFDDTLAVAQAVAAASDAKRPLVFPHTPAGYLIGELEVPEGTSLIGLGGVRIRAPSRSTNSVLRLLGGCTMRGFTIDGEGSHKTRIRLGSSRQRDNVDNIVFEQNSVENCPINSIRTAEFANNIVVRGNSFEGSKVFNTHDRWTGQKILIVNNVANNIPVEGILIDMPGIDNTSNEIIISGNLLSLTTSASRCIGIARGINVMVSNNICIGNRLCDDLIHCEDKAEHISIIGNLLDLNGANFGIDASLGGDKNFNHVDRQSRRIFVSGNSIQTRGKTGIWFQGSQPDFFEAVTVVSNQIYDSETPISLRAANSVVADNVIYGARKSIRITPSDVENGGSKQGASVLLSNNRYISPHFFKGDSGHAASDDVVFRRDAHGLREFIRTKGPDTENLVVFQADLDGLTYLRYRPTMSSECEIRFSLPSQELNIGQGDALTVRLMTRSSRQTMGRAGIMFPSERKVYSETVLNAEKDFETWKLEGHCKQVRSGGMSISADILVDLNHRALEGSSVDIAWIEVCRLRQPF